MNMDVLPLPDIRGVRQHQNARENGWNHVNLTPMPRCWERIGIFMAVSPQRVTRGAKERNDVIDRGKTRALTPWNWWETIEMTTDVLALQDIRGVRTPRNVSDRGK